MTFRNETERRFWCDVYLQALRNLTQDPETAADEAIRDLRQRTGKPGCLKCGDDLDDDGQKWIVTGGIGAVRVCPPCHEKLALELNPKAAGTN